MANFIEGRHITTTGIISPRGDYGIFFQQDGGMVVVRNPYSTQEIVFKADSSGDVKIAPTTTDKIGFFGATPVAQQTAATAQVAAAPAGGTGATAGAYDTAANRDTAIAAINNNRTRIAEIETALKNLGILPA